MDDIVMVDATAKPTIYLDVPESVFEILTNSKYIFPVFMPFLFPYNDELCWDLDKITQRRFQKSSCLDHVDIFVRSLAKGYQKLLSIPDTNIDENFWWNTGYSKEMIKNKIHNVVKLLCCNICVCGTMICNDCQAIRKELRKDLKKYLVPGECINFGIRRTYKG